MLLLHQRLEALHHAAGADVLHILADAGPVDQLAQDEGIARRQRIDGELLALEVGVALDLRHRDEAQKAVVAAHEREDVGLRRRRRRALPLHVGDDVVDRGHGDVELAVDQTRELELRVRRRRDLHADAAPSEEPLLAPPRSAS